MTTRGVMSQGGTVRAVGEVAAAADAAGFDAVWTTEFYTRSATLTMAEMAHRTERCRIGSAIAYGVGRSPLMTVVEARDLDDMSGGRVVLGLGNGTRRMMEDWHGIADSSSPAVRLEELVTVLRKLFRLHEGPVSHDGRFYHLNLVPTVEVPEPLRPEIPIYTAGVNPRMIESAGRVADGLCAHPVHTVKFLQEVARPAIARGAEKTGRDPGDIAVVATPITVIHEDAEQARREAAAQIAFYAAPKSYAPIFDVDGFAPQAERIRECFARRDLEAMVAEVTDDMIDAMAIAGTPADVEAGLRRFEGVADHLALYSPSFGLTSERVMENTMAIVEHCGPGVRT